MVSNHPGSGSDPPIGSDYKRGATASWYHSPNWGRHKPWFHKALIFSSMEFSLPRLEKYRVFDLLVVGNGGSLMLVCSNVHVFGGFFYF